MSSLILIILNELAITELISPHDFLFQHLGDSTKLLEDIASGKHPFAAVCVFHSLVVLTAV